MKAEILAVFGNDLMVVNAARVSMSKWHDTFDPESDTRLIDYLAREGHWSPFSHPKASFLLHLPIFVARQWEKHRVGCVRGYDIYDQNEQSRRYVDDGPMFFAPKQWRSRPDGNIKQGSGGPLPEDASRIADAALKMAHAQARDSYLTLLETGVAPEQARMVLPQTMYTTWVETGSLSYWSRLCDLRMDAHAQREINDLACQVSAQMETTFPVSWAALTEHKHV